MLSLLNLTTVVIYCLKWETTYKLCTYILLHKS